MNTGHPLKVLPETIAPYGVEPELPMKDKSRKISAPDASAEAKKQSPMLVSAYHLDTNHHMNNGRYAELASACLPEDYEIHSVHISYKKAAVKGDWIYPVLYKMEDRCQVALRNEQGEDYCICEFH